MILKMILNRNKDRVEKLRNKVKKLKEPIRLPRNILFKEAFLLRVILTVINSKKSKKKFKKKTASK